MRTSFFLFMTTVLALTCAPYASAQASVQNTFTTNLSLGSRGTQVMALQQILNRDPDTRIQGTGPGSPGKETSYFGPLTEAAVVRFQEKYANDILVPAGLTQGNGYVGFYTRMKLNALSAPITSMGNARTFIRTVTPPVAATSTSSPQNPNLKNISVFFAALDEVGKKQGLSSTTLAVLKEQALRRLATTTDLRAAFLKAIQGKTNQTAVGNSFVDKALATVKQAFDAVFMPERALAATGVPFGGALLFAFPCDGGIWNLTIEPLPPSYAALLTYLPGSQAFLSYNIPATSWLLGEYEPGASVACWVGIYPFPSEGLISPMTGSSPL